MSLSTAPAGPCEWCGGPQAWTIIAGEMYVSCDGGCSPIPGLGLDPPPDSPELVEPSEMEQRMEGGVGPLEGGDASEQKKEEYELPW